MPKVLPLLVEGVAGVSGTPYAVGVIERGQFNSNRARGLADPHAGGDLAGRMHGSRPDTGFPWLAQSLVADAEGWCAAAWYHRGLR